MQRQPPIPTGNAKNGRHRSSPSDYAEFAHFLSLFLQRTAKKCSKNYNAPTKPLFYSLNLLFSTFSLSSSLLTLLSWLRKVCSD